MRNFDRIMIAALALGVWALVLKPSGLNAHDDHTHELDIACVADGSMSKGRPLKFRCSGVTSYNN